MGGDLLPVPGSPKPITWDPAHPYVPNNVGKQPTYRIADLTNPLLKPWVVERMKKDNDEVLAGKIAYTARSSCRPAGTPAFMLIGGFQPLFFLQTPKEVWMVYSRDAQVRRVYLDVPHSANPKPSYYGESVGHYEGDTLVVDTIGLNDKTFIDNYRTPHTEKLHVIERWRMIDGGNRMEVMVRIEDPDTFNEPWSAVQHYRRVSRRCRRKPARRITRTCLITTSRRRRSRTFESPHAGPKPRRSQKPLNRFREWVRRPSLRCREPVPDQVPKHPDCEVVCQHERFGAALG
jgi:hypothetical protein